MNICGKIVELLLWLLVTCAIILVSLSPPAMVAPAIMRFGGDKIAHFAAYAALGFITFLVFGSVFSSLRTQLSRRYLVTVLYCAAVGGALEVLQPAFGRTFLVLDFFVDIAGGAAGALIALGIVKTCFAVIVTHTKK